MIDKIMNLILKKGVDDAIVSQLISEGVHLKFVNNKIVKSSTEENLTIEIFVAKKGRLISTMIQDGDDRTIKKVVDGLMRFIDKVEKNESYRGIAKGPFTYKKIEDSYDKKVLNINAGDMVEEGINIAIEEGAKRVSGIFETSYGELSLISSQGVKASDKKTSIYYSVRALVDDDASGHMNSCSCVLDKLNIKGTSRRAGEIAKIASNPMVGKPGKYNVIFSPLAFAPLLNSMGEAASIFSVESGTSFFKDKLNEKIGSFSLIDNGDLPNGLGSLAFDEEGRPTQETKIIDNGILKTYLHNTSSAYRYNVKPTGNAGLISPRSTNLVLDGKNGDVFDIKNGLYITNVWYTRFNNYATGDFSTIPRDGIFLIKNGEITKSLKGIRVSDNLVRMMKNISLFGKKKVQIKSWEADDPCLLSEVLVKNVNITMPST